MDAYNVISISYDLNELDAEMEKWSNLPYEMRLHADDECIRRYGCTNIDLYNRTKAYILSVKPLPKDEEIDVNESTNIILDSDNSIYDNQFFSSMEDYEEKCEYTRQLNRSICIALIDPDTDNIIDLNNAYMKFINLNDDDKTLSNSYSLCIWGYNVYNMYIIIKNHIDTVNSEYNLECTLESFIEDSVCTDIAENNKLGLIKYRLKMCNTGLSEVESLKLSSLTETVNNKYYDKGNNYSLPKVVPYYTNEEKSLITYDSKTEVTNENYCRLAINAVNGYKNSTGANKDHYGELLENLGIPSAIVDTTNDVFGVCRYRQRKYLEAYAPTVVDISDIKVDKTDLIRESTYQMRNLYKRKNLYPIYIVLSYTDTFFGNIIRKVKKSTYTHAAICLDSNLKEMVTFKFDTKTGENGITIEDLDFYLTKSNDSLITVIAVFVDAPTRANIADAINKFIVNKEKTRYSIGNLFNILINRSIKDDPNKLVMVCSQFVDSILKLSRININGNKSSNLVIPQDFVNIKNPKVFKLYEGFVRNYSDKEIEARITYLLKTEGRKNMIYTDLVNTMSESATNLIELFRFTDITDNDKANAILEEARELLTPTAVIYERKLPLTIKDDGTISIALYKSLEQEYQESHKIIQSSTDRNINGLKHEMARLFYINSVLEKKLNKMDKNSPNYKESIDLRARVMNDFHKISKIVFDKDINFDFNKYFKKSEYSNESLEVDYNVLKYSGKLIKSIIGKG